MISVRDAFYEMARQLGLNTWFGNPGSTEETMLEAFPDDFPLCPGPTGGVSRRRWPMATARRPERPVLVNLHTAAGMGNALSGLETAWFNRTPLIVVAGQQTREMLLHDPYLVNPDVHDIASPLREVGL